MLKLCANKTLLAALLICRIPSPAQQDKPWSGAPTFGDYTPPAFTVISLLKSDKPLGIAWREFVRTRDVATLRKAVQSAASSGDVGSQLFLGEQYIPDRCEREPDKYVPDCSPDDQERPGDKVLRPLNLPPSYERAADWLERASAQGAGEASESLALIIDRMLAIGHTTTYTAADSARLHALARSQGYDLDSLMSLCFKRVNDLGPLRGEPRARHFAPENYQSLLVGQGLHGELDWQGGGGPVDSPAFIRPDWPNHLVAIILDHNPGREVHLPLPLRHDAVYLQQGEEFLLLPNDTPTSARVISLTPDHADASQVKIFVQSIDGTYFGGSNCARF